MATNEQRDARKLMKHLEIRYTHALRLLREGKYVVRDGVPRKIEEGEESGDADGR